MTGTLHRLRPVLLAWLFVVGWSGTPYLVAALRPPAGTAFLGFFYYRDDHYNYLSYVEQAQRGKFLFTNKLVLEEHAGALVNLEWWLVGRLSAVLGDEPRLAYRLFALLAALGLLVGVDAWLTKGGLPDTHRLPALLLVTTGGGLGGLLWHLGGRSLPQCLDIYAGLFPFMGLLVNPHFTAGTALLLACLWAYEAAETPAGLVVATALATSLAVVRPYDFVLVVAIRATAVAILDPPSRWARQLLPLAALAPAAGYLYWLFYRNPAFAFYPEANYAFPPARDFLWAVGPAALLAALVFHSSASTTGTRRAQVHLLAWAAMALVVIAARPVHFSLQFLVGVGVPLLGLGALGLRRFAPAVTLGAACLFASSAVTVTRFLLVPNPLWFVPAERLAAAESLAGNCGPGDVLFAPADIGRYAAGLSACRAWVSHPIEPSYSARTDAVLAFYESWPPSERAAFLNAQGVTHLLLPGDAGTVPVAWLGEDTSFRLLALVGQPPAVLSLYRRGEEKSPASP